MRLIKMTSVAVILLLVGTACNAQKRPSKKKDKSVKEEVMELKTEIDSVSYGIGVNIGRNLVGQGLDALSIEAIAEGLKDVMTGDSLKMNEEECMAFVNKYMQEAQTRKAQEASKEGRVFLEENGKKDGVVTLESGMQYSIITKGTGAIPGPTDKVKTHYHGTLINGEVFDSSVTRGEPATFGVNQVIKGWTEASQLMTTGDK
ncbi:MAG: FKBP-type peptidyl-prolyl cis-trans isomerase, partial [Flavobacteriales bacterium]|nr:FKBP-type peptidyl-prolyl cis-trans isomerase [Flavobacteriales bacterium]